MVCSAHVLFRCTQLKYSGMYIGSSITSKMWTYHWSQQLKTHYTKQNDLNEQKAMPFILFCDLEYTISLLSTPVKMKNIMIVSMKRVYVRVWLFQIYKYMQFIGPQNTLGYLSRQLRSGSCVSYSFQLTHYDLQF